MIIKKLTKGLLFASMLFTTAVLFAEPAWTIVKVSQDVNPQAFRRTVDPIISPDWSNPSQDGYYRLNASAAGAFSDQGFDWLLTRIPRSDIVFVDVRQESHAIINGHAMSWRDGDNWLNDGFSAEEIEQDEQAKVEQALTEGAIALGSFSMPVQSAQTDRQIIEENGSRYVRLPIADNSHPSDQVADAFVELWKEVPRGTWIHFTSEKGGIRATTLMAMQDMMYNAKAIQFDHILKRQHLVGGYDFLNPNWSSDRDQELGEARMEFLQSFYNYCAEAGFDYETSWSDWKAAQ